MDLLHGFRLVNEAEVVELAASARIFEHETTGARVLCLQNADENKVFGISFRTPPADSTGLPHILEHSVLCGSRKFPVKEPFVELLKGSLQTFLNALTFPDKTCYPVASANQRDFRNLMDVYLDAVFFPRLTPLTLKQEGWHYEPADSFAQDRALEYKGVVFNEMKGAYSSPDGLLAELSQQSVFPGNCYSLDSGGDPAVIPDLTFERFEAFHKRHYHPSNSYTMLYGDYDEGGCLELLDAYFAEFGRGEPSEEIALQPPLSGAARVERSFAADEDAGAMFTVNYGLPDADPDLTLRMEVLEHLLIGLPSSPLRKALLDSGLGEDLAGIGLETDLRQMYFSVGLKGVEPGRVAEAEAVIASVLESLSRAVPKHDVEAAVNSVEFDLRENNTGSYPRGLSIMFRALSSWLYGGDPLAPLAWSEPLKRLKKEVDDGLPVFEKLIGTHFLNNPHRTVVLLAPDPALGERLAEEERQRLDTARAAMAEDDLLRIEREAAELHELQGREDAPEALATIPRLGLEDLPRYNRHIPIEAYEKGEAKTFLHTMDTSGIVYLDLGFDLRALPDRLMGYVPVFGRALLEMGTDNQDYVSLQNRIARKTGGIEPQTFTAQPLPEASGAPGAQAVAKLFLRGKATAERAEDLVEILLEVLMLGRFDNQERFRQIVLEAKARFEQRLVPSGHALVAARLRARMNEAGWIGEQLSGATQLFFLRDLARKVDEDYAAVLADLEEIRDRIFSNQSLVINITAEEADFMRVNPGIAALTRALPDIGSTLGRSRERAIPAFARFEGLRIPAQVNFVGKGVNLAASGIDLSGGSEVASRFLRTAYLWDRVRVQGGAYGAFSLFDRIGATLNFVSYRDPNLEKTVAAFDGVGEHLLRTALSHDDIEKSIIGTIGAMDEYLLPDAKGFVSMTRALTGVTPDWRQRVREEVLSTSSRDFRHFAEAAYVLARQGDVVVLGGEKALQGAPYDFAMTKLL
jgi:Zn-dependent M16 (insulinase) family peptidase